MTGRKYSEHKAERKNEMIEKIKELVNQYEALLKEKSRLKQLEDDNKELLKKKEDELCQAISDADMKNFSCGNYTYTPKVKNSYYVKSAAAALECGYEDRFEPFRNDPALSSLIREEINWRQLQSAMHELEDNGGVPDEIMSVLTYDSSFGISRRKADTSSKDNVAKQLAERRKGE